jgi:hypothetical protein
VAVFFRPHIRFLWSGLGEGALALAGSFARYANLVMLPATTIGVVPRVTYFSKGVLIMCQRATTTAFCTGKPTHPDVYMTRRGTQSRHWFSLWDGKRWHTEHLNADEARNAPYISNFQRRSWAPIVQTPAAH